MAGEISRVRLLIHDPAGDSQVFSDDDIEATLAEHEISDGEYDAYAAAADLLEVWAAREKLSFDVNADGASFSRSQKARLMLAQAAQYRRQQRPSIVQQVRNDVNA